MFAPAPDTAAFVSVLRTVTNSARSRLVTFRALTDCVGGCGCVGVGWRGGKRYHQKFSTIFKCVVCEGREGRERKRKKGGVRKGGRGRDERRRIHDLLTFSLADVSHDDHQLLLEESL